MKLQKNLLLSLSKKAARAIRPSLSAVRQCVKEHHGWAAMVENCGMAEEHLWINAEDMPEHPGYYTLVIVKDRKDEEE